jgi:hypothetical protein
MGILPTFQVLEGGEPSHYQYYLYKHGDLSGRTLPQTLRKRDLRAPDSPFYGDLCSRIGQLLREAGQILIYMCHWDGPFTKVQKTTWIRYSNFQIHCQSEGYDWQPSTVKFTLSEATIETENMKTIQITHQSMETA